MVVQHYPANSPYEIDDGLDDSQLEGGDPQALKTFMGDSCSSNQFTKHLKLVLIFHSVNFISISLHPQF